LLSGPNAQLLLDAIPEVAPLVPKDHPTPKTASTLPAKEARDRIVQLLTDLIHIFTEQTVLTLCFDDLQWADSASLELLNAIAVECRHSLFMVCILLLLFFISFRFSFFTFHFSLITLFYHRCGYTVTMNLPQSTFS
jgi:predicted ATPase